MSLGLILIIVLLLCLFGAWPNGPVPISNSWGYGPFGIIGIILIVLIILALSGRI